MKKVKVTFADKEWLASIMADKDWPSFCHFAWAFSAGLIALLGGLYWIVRWII